MLRNMVSLQFSRSRFVLNEVLSLNAQEFCPKCGNHSESTILNEVLSLNAQESKYRRETVSNWVSSMKS